MRPFITVIFRLCVRFIDNDRFDVNTLFQESQESEENDTQNMFDVFAFDPLSQ